MNSFQKQEIDDFRSNHKKSLSLWNRSLKKFPGGVNHNIRTLGLPLIDAYPVFISSSSAISINDIDGNKYSDFWLGHYSQILGHNNSAIREKLQIRLQQGWMFGTVIEEQVLLAERITSVSKKVEKVRFQTSGSESVMNAIRLARAYTNRDVIAKVDLGWHGANETIVNGINKRAIEVQDSDSLGLQKIITFRLTNDSITSLFKEFGPQLACVIIEPVIGSGGAFKVEIDLLKLLRESCDMYGIVLIYDEIITGFRFQYGLYQDKIGIYPDLTSLGKIIGGGFPVGGVGGIEEIMDLADPSSTKPNKVTIGGGTFSSHPMTMAAGVFTLDALNEKNNQGAFEKLNSLGDHFQKELNELFREYNKKYICTNYGSLIFINCLKSDPWEKEIPPFEIMNNIDKQEQAYLQLYFLNRHVYGYHGLGSLSFLHTKMGLEKILDDIEDILQKSKN